MSSSVDLTRSEPALLRTAEASAPTPVRVVVLDTGLAPTSMGGAAMPQVSAMKPAEWGPTKPGVQTDNLDLPDADNNTWLDVVAGHGTFIAGIITRLAPHAVVTVGKVLEYTGEGNDADLAWRINRIADAGCPEILALSCSCYTDNDEPPIALRQAIERIQQGGTLVVAAAGNEATCRVSWPSALPGVIAVGALGPNGPAPFTNYGEWVTACAPGVDIVSRFFDGVDVHDDGNAATADFRGWARWSGTSFSAPIVAAAIAREAALYSITIAAGAERVVYDKRLFRIPGLGTVVNMH